MSKLFDDIVQGFDEIADREGNPALKAQTQKYIKKEKCAEGNPIFCKRRFYSWTHPIKNIRLFFRCIKWSFQRIQKGYSDIDIGDYDVWMTSLLQNSILDFKKKLEEGCFDSEKYKFDLKLEELCYLLQESDDATCEDANTEDWGEIEVYCNNKLKEAFDLLCELFHSLWLP